MALAAERGFLLARLRRITHEAARPMLVTQAAIGSTISAVFIFVPTVESVFWVLAALLVQLYLLMYMLLFASVWKLRHKQPQRPRPWRIPGGRVGIGVVCGVGLFFSAAAFVVGFVPPGRLGVGTLSYLAVLGTGLGISLLVPAALVARRHS